MHLETLLCKDGIFSHVIASNKNGEDASDPSRVSKAYCWRLEYESSDMPKEVKDFYFMFFNVCRSARTECSLASNLLSAIEPTDGIILSNAPFPLLLQIIATFLQILIPFYVNLFMRIAVVDNRLGWEPHCSGDIVLWSSAQCIKHRPKTIHTSVNKKYYAYRIKGIVR